MCAPAHSLQEREGGSPPKQERTPFVRGPIQEMGGIPQDPRSPPTTRLSGEEGAIGEEKPGVGVGGGAPPLLGERGTPEEQAQAIVARIVNFLLGGGPPSGQALESNRQQTQHIRGVRGRGSRGRSGGERGRGEKGETKGKICKKPHL